MDTTVALKAALRERALALGFCDIGFCPAEPFAEWSEKAYSALKLRLHADPKELMAGARSIAVAVRRYTVYGGWPKGSARVVNYYVNSIAGYDNIKKVAEVLTGAGYTALPNPALPAKPAALCAGLGFQGMNTQFSHRDFGMLVSLHLILTDAPLAGEASPRSECPNCGICVSACPSGAISERGFDHEKCLRFLMTSGVAVPLWARDLMGLRLMGCTDCQHACPNASRDTVEEVPAELAWACDIAGLLEGDGARYEKLAEYIGTNFARKNRIRAQAALCAGNSGDRAYVPLLAALLNDDHTALRCHAAWALGKLGGPEAKEALETSIKNEANDEVKREVAEALQMCLERAGTAACPCGFPIQ
jgi:epoxyqueuosine reductase